MAAYFVVSKVCLAVLWTQGIQLCGHLVSTDVALMEEFLCEPHFNNAFGSFASNILH